MSSQFIWLLNHFAKAVIKQYLLEASADTTKAEGVGQIVASIFSDPAFLWRGKSLIDILQAKYHRKCPVLFGARGDDTTPAGRVSNGWKKIDGRFITEVAHYSRMTGLAAGFASLTLRDFSRKPDLQNPWSPVAYWEAIALILSSPTEQLCDTQCVVLKAMIEHFEAGFIKQYGSAAVAAMQAAVVVFPARFTKRSAHVEALAVHSKLLAQNTGLDLSAI